MKGVHRKIRRIHELNHKVKLKWACEERHGVYGEENGEDGSMWQEEQRQLGTPTRMFMDAVNEDLLMVGLIEQNLEERRLIRCGNS